MKKKVRIAIFGDIMLDRYIIGDVNRISPEAPVPILKVKKEKYMPGGCANVAANISTLGGNAHLFGYTGDDSAKDKLYKQLDLYKINHDNVWPALPLTTQKIRIIGHQQQLLRVDDENYEVVNRNCINFIKNYLEVISNEFDAIIISDYAKGFITNELIIAVKHFARIAKIPIIVDPKPTNKHLYKDVFLITPNKSEAEQMTGIKIETEEDIENCAKKLREELNCNVVITLGEEGMVLVKNDKESIEKGKDIIHLSTKAREVYDVSGAGDTVVAALTMSLVHNYSLEDSVRISNIAAGIKVGKHGTAPVSLQELCEYYYVNWE